MVKDDHVGACLQGLDDQVLESSLAHLELWMDRGSPLEARAEHGNAARTRQGLEFFQGFLRSCDVAGGHAHENSALLVYSLGCFRRKGSRATDLLLKISDQGTKLDRGGVDRGKRLPDLPRAVRVARDQ